VHRVADRAKGPAVFAIFGLSFDLLGGEWAVVAQGEHCCDLPAVTDLDKVPSDCRSLALRVATLACDHILG